MQPNFLIIGAQKSATSYLRACLAAHPRIFMVMSELSYFEDPHYDPARFDEFVALFDASGEATAIGVKRADLLSRPECALRIHRHLPGARLIAVLRNPADRAFAAYHYAIKKDRLPAQGFERWLANRSEAMASDVIRYGFYHAYLQAYFDAFPAPRIKVVLFEDLVARPATMIAQLYGFLGVDAGVRIPPPKRRVNKGVYNVRRLRVRQLMRRKSRGGPGQRVQGKLINLADYLVFRRLWREPRRGPGDDARRSLRDIYGADIARLEGLLGRDLSAWTGP